MNPYQGQPQFQQNFGVPNMAPQSFSNPMPMPGMPMTGYPAPQPVNPYQPIQGVPQFQGSLQPSQGYPQSSPGFPQQQGYPNQGYAQPSPNPQAQLGYPTGQTMMPPGNQTQGQSNQYQMHPTNQNLQTYSAASPVMQVPKSKPTVVPVKPFNPREDGAVLRKAMKGFGTDEKAIIQLLTRRSNEQRVKIALEYKTLFGKDLIVELKSETSGKFRDLLVALMTPLSKFYATELHDAMDGIGTNEAVLIEVMCTVSNHEINVIKQAYEAIYGHPLEKDIRGDTSGNFKKLMTSLCLGNRSENLYVDQEKAKEDARNLHKAGKLRLGTDESVFNTVLTTRSLPHLAAVFQQYQFIANHDIDDAIKSEFSGDIEKALRTIVKVVRNKPLFFAESLHKSMKGLGTNDRQLIRIMVTRCELDLADISDIFQSRYGEKLRSWIEGDCSGHYKKCLLGLLGLY